VADFKVAAADEQKTFMYARQLHAYAHALENPAPDALRLQPVTRLGLLYFEPDDCAYIGEGRQAISGQLTWIEIPKDELGFMKLLGEVVSLLDGPLPDPAEKCPWCDYLLRVRAFPRHQPDADPGALGNARPPLCPDCGSPMKLRKGRHGPFWGCLAYPKCKGTRNA